MNQSLQDKIKEHIINGRTNAALTLLLELSQSNKQINDAIYIIIGEFNVLNSQRLKGTIDNSEATLRLNIIHDKILIALDSFDDQSDEQFQKENNRSKAGLNLPEKNLSVTKPGVFRYFLNRFYPRLYLFLIRIGFFSQPPELETLHTYLRSLQSEIENDIKGKTYLPLKAKEVPQNFLVEKMPSGPFLLPVHQIIKSIAGQALGGDSSSAQIAALSRKSKVVKNIINKLLHALDPLVLLGDPGTGKTMTLQETAHKLAGNELKRAFPNIVIYVRLGEFLVEQTHIGPRDVLDYVKKSAIPEIQPYFDDLRRTGRLIILFDGMDEMSRHRYNEYTEALSLFAGENRGLIKTLFTCRITDFSPKFIHQRLVLLPFNLSQITGYLKAYLPSSTVIIEGKEWNIKNLAKRLSEGNLPVEATNPFVLWLLSFHIQQKGSWPRSRVELLHFFNEENYKRKAEGLLEDELPFQPITDTFQVWSRLAYLITSLNRGAAVQIKRLQNEPNFQMDNLFEYIRIGKRCGVLEESKDEGAKQIRFQHHRFQEFFTAYYIHHEKPKIDWLDKMDAPRWQETMLNLILMGEEPEATKALVAAVEMPIQDYSQLLSESEKALQEQDQKEVNEEKSELQVQEDDFIKKIKALQEQQEEEENMPQLEESVEILLADRVELGTRIIRQSNPEDVVTKTELMPSLENAITFLVQRGNPITQVKMMNACANVPDFDAIEALEKLLKSPVRWVRDQALTLLSGASNRVIGSNLSSEMAFDLASGVLFQSLPAYWKVITKNKGHRQWWSFICGVLFGVIDFLMPFALSFVMYLLVYRYARLFSSDIHRTLHSTFFTEYLHYGYFLIITGVFVWSIREKPGSKTTNILLIGAAFWLFCLLILSLWYSLIQSFWIILLVSGGAIMIGLPLFSLISIMISFSILSFFIITNFWTISKSHSLKTFYLTTLSVMDDEWERVEDILEDLPSIITIQVVGLIAYFLISISPIVKFMFIWTDFIYPLIEYFFSIKCSSDDYLIVLFFIFFIVIYLILITTILIDVYDFYFSKKIKAFLCLAAFPISYCIYYYFILGLICFISSIQNFLNKAVVIILAFAVIAFLLWIINFLIQQIISTLILRPYPPGSFTRIKWINLIIKSRAHKQREILLRTTNQSVSLNAEQFLELLKEVKGVIKNEPALSTYWEKRNQLETILKQERIG